jgi:Zn-dependent peptidase ImmA (M78 family)
MQNTRFIETVVSLIPEFNRCSLTLEDLERICEAQNIELLYRNMRLLHGMAIQCDGVDVLRLNKLISYSEQVIAGFHELFHFLFHPVDSQVCLSYGRICNISKRELQAQIVGVIALLPISLVYKMTVEDMMREFEISKEIALFRLKVFQEHRI